ncbi:DUF4019 domain-containing protein [Desulfospira joergensenii]|uniref:DUF4019 domain-containing protein n=1 Tax=Desulfospira joergensenii TaxID=53329 RepID=UPI0003B2F07E|nr:DUF4019 domain-containing protein [Desulfospira joergensenii]
MKIIHILAVAILFLGSLTGLSVARETKDHAQAENQEGIARAGVWLGLIDARKYDEAWQTSAKVFQSAIPHEQWAKTAASVRTPLGSLIQRNLFHDQFTKSMPGMADGQYLILQFLAEFKNKKSAVETLTLVMEPDGIWRVAGYFIK